METSVGSTIEKIKLQEQDTEAKLKEIREHEIIVANLNKTLRDTVLQIEKLQQEHKELIKKTDKLRAQMEVERIRRQALSKQIESCNKQLEDLRRKCADGVSLVWEQRSTLCKEVQKISDECDIWALLTKPKRMELFTVPSNNDLVQKCKNQLQNAIERRDKAIKERDRLLKEPNEGEEFVRLKNAIQYSSELIANLRKK